MERAKAENAIIYWADETGVSSCEVVERGFSPKGRPPVLPVETKRQRVNMISAISDQGSVRFMVYQDTMDQQHSTIPLSFPASSSTLCFPIFARGSNIR